MGEVERYEGVNASRALGGKYGWEGEIARLCGWKEVGKRLGFGFFRESGLQGILRLLGLSGIVRVIRFSRFIGVSRDLAQLVVLHA